MIFTPFTFRNGIFQDNNFKSTQDGNNNIALQPSGYQYSKLMTSATNKSYPLKINLIQNGGFENIDPGKLVPIDYSYSATGYSNSTLDYTQFPINGSHSGLVEAQGSNFSSGSGYLYYGLNNQIPLSQNLSFSVKLNATFNFMLDVNKYLNSYIQFSFYNQTGLNYNYIDYFFSYGYSVSNYNYSWSSYRYIMVNQSSSLINFVRNLKFDYTSCFGNINNIVLINDVYFYINSPTRSPLNKLIIDDFSLKNQTNYEYINDGDFESVNTNWYRGNEYSTSVVTTSVENTEGTKSLKLETLNKNSDALSSASMDYSFSTVSRAYTNPTIAKEPVLFSFDWKFNLNTGAGQYAYIMLSGGNQTYNFRLYWYLGWNSPLSLGNYTGQYEFLAPDFNITSNWNTFNLNITQLYSLLNITNCYLYDFTTNIESDYPATNDFNILLDNLSIYAYPLGDVGFENQLHDYSSPNSQDGWYVTNGGYPDINITSSDFFEGNYALNITSTGGHTNVLSHNLEMSVKPGYFTAFHFKLDEVTNGAYAYIAMTYNYVFNVIYVIGGPNNIFSNDSTDFYYYVKGYNQLHSWNLIFRNLQDDVKIGLNLNDLYLTSVQLYVDTQSNINSRISVLFDEMQFFQDITPPMLNSVSWSNPFYYKPTTVTISLTDDYSNIQSGIIHYTNSTNWFSATFTPSSGNNYTSDIEKFPYGTNVTFFITVSDRFGNFINYTNNGNNYSFIIQDDIAPSLFVYSLSSNLTNGSVINGTMSLFINGQDDGSGLKNASFTIGNSKSSISTFPIKYDLDTTTIPNGDTKIEIDLFDKAGNVNKYILSVKISNINKNDLSYQFNDFIMANGVAVGAGSVITLYIAGKLLIWKIKKK